MAFSSCGRTSVERAQSTISCSCGRAASSGFDRDRRRRPNPIDDFAGAQRRSRRAQDSAGVSVRLRHRVDARLAASRDVSGGSLTMRRGCLRSASIAASTAATARSCTELCPAPRRQSSRAQRVAIARGFLAQRLASASSARQHGGTLHPPALAARAAVLRSACTTASCLPRSYAAAHSSSTSSARDAACGAVAQDRAVGRELRVEAYLRTWRHQ